MYTVKGPLVAELINTPVTRVSHIYLFWGENINSPLLEMLITPYSLIH